ncbi:MAG: hypothetical protein WBZ20_07155, partial [Nitrososphaeraceae archaeon]
CYLIDTIATSLFVLLQESWELIEAFVRYIVEIFNDSPNQTTTVTHILKTLEEGMELYYDEYV